VQLEEEPIVAVLDRTNTIKLTTIDTQILRTLIFHTVRGKVCAGQAQGRVTLNGSARQRTTSYAGFMRLWS